MTTLSEKSVVYSSVPYLIGRKYIKRVTFLGVVLLMILYPSTIAPVHGQSSGALIRVVSGYPTELPADNQSTTLLEVNYDNCSFGVPTSSSGNYSISISSTKGQIDPSFSSSLDGGIFPPPITLKADSVPGSAVIDVIVSYCPADAVVLMGVCSDPTYMDAQCTGSTTFQFIEAESMEDSQGPAAVPPAQSNQDSPSTSSSEPEEEQISLAEIYDDLEEFLAGEGITAPTPGQIGASGTALVTLLVGWLVLNRWSGIDPEKSLKVIQAWKDGERPPIGTEAELPTDFGDGDVGAEGEVPDKPPKPAEPDETVAQKRSLVQEGVEERALRSIKDAQDYDNTLKKFNKDLEAFEGKIPDQVKNSEAWKKHVAPKWKKAKDLAKKGELDKARTWLDRAEELLNVRKKADEDLGYLPPDQREGIVWVERTIKTLAHIASDAYETFILKPIKSAAEKILPARGARVITKSVDEVGQGVSDVGQGIGELARRGGRLVSHGKAQDNLQHTLETTKSPGLREEAQFHSDLLAGKDRKVPPVYPDWSRSPRKVMNWFTDLRKQAFGGD